MAQSDNHPDPKTRQGNSIGKNWHPISLLCPAAKTLETLLLPKILTGVPFHPAQHGFRPKHSTCTALSTITADIAAGFSIKKAGSPNNAHCARSDMHLTMLTVNNCFIVSSTPTYWQQSVAGSTTICRTDEPKFIFGEMNLRAEM